NVVQPAYQRVNVLSVEGGDESAVEAVQCLMGEVVGLVLLVANHLQGCFDARKLTDQLIQLFGGGDDVLDQVLKKVVEDRVLREEIEHGRGLCGGILR